MLLACVAVVAGGTKIAWPVGAAGGEWLDVVDLVSGFPAHPAEATEDSDPCAQSVDGAGALDRYAEALAPVIGDADDDGPVRTAQSPRVVPSGAVHDPAAEASRGTASVDAPVPHPPRVVALAQPGDANSNRLPAARHCAPAGRLHRQESGASDVTSCPPPLIVSAAPASGPLRPVTTDDRAVDGERSTHHATAWGSGTTGASTCCQARTSCAWNSRCSSTAPRNALNTSLSAG